MKEAEGYKLFSKKTATGYMGVYEHPSGRFRAHRWDDDKYGHIGYYDTAVEAAVTYAKHVAASTGSSSAAAAVIVPNHLHEGGAYDVTTRNRQQPSECPLSLCTFRLRSEACVIMCERFIYTFEQNRSSYDTRSFSPAFAARRRRMRLRLPRRRRQLHIRLAASTSRRRLSVNDWPLPQPDVHTVLRPRFDRPARMNRPPVKRAAACRYSTQRAALLELKSNAQMREGRCTARVCSDRQQKSEISRLPVIAVRSAYVASWDGEK